MKRFLISILAIGCIAVLLIGYQHWQEKTFVSAENESPTTITIDEGEQPKVDHDELLKLTENWPETAQHRYKEKVENNETFTVLLAGSLALGSDENSWSQQVKQKLEESFGDTIKVVIKTYGGTSAQLVEDEALENWIEEKPDFTLLEPLTLNDNSNVTISASHQHIEEVKTALEEANPEHTLVLQPPNPLHNANYYPVQVDALMKFAEDEKIPYLDHWEAWPNPDRDEMKDYLEPMENTTVPSEKGHQVWADYVLAYLINN
ncbi:SGNH/GDSL hydrolase family protein [Mesobacillus maritimus]|uniref:SGNH/GDSL hydrolase family protein n=1 Tax=Mesobacillus maritimus TaxID=1643336 RepID=UPI00203AEBFE|nr:SGNH/GDSL hydrolase family protein [Mesobacillus maritimus]MCM3670887.1 SGNH/GDSL hydrolase family protein [Mesobacillus maritimus]